MSRGPLLLGYDLGSSSVKVALLDSYSGKLLASAQAPTTEMEISSPRSGWAEQDPEQWWRFSIEATRKVLASAGVDPKEIGAIGISYQMHGLVAVDRNGTLLRPSIIWCDSRAVEIGNKAEQDLGREYCQKQLLNSPGNFTASKLRWIRENEPDVYARIDRVMLPGDYLAFRMSGTIATTISGLSEGIFWNHPKGEISKELLSLYDIDPSLLAEVVSTFGIQGRLTAVAAAELGLAAGTKICYRAGDQPNNAFSLKALNPGEVAATAGTSGVVYAVADQPVSDSLSRVNTFVHVSHSSNASRWGVLLCVNGTGIMNSWARKLMSSAGTLSYDELNQMAARVPVGAEGVTVLPFGNGAERMLENRTPGAVIQGLNLNRHRPEHVARAVQEGIVFSLGYGFEILRDMGIRPTVIRAGRANMFLSDVFCEAFTAITGAKLELLNTDGAQGAARGAGVGSGIYPSAGEAFEGLHIIKAFQPDTSLTESYRHAYTAWKKILLQQLTLLT